jgi:hypothetical protein
VPDGYIYEDYNNVMARSILVDLTAVARAILSGEPYGLAPVAGIPSHNYDRLMPGHGNPENEAGHCQCIEVLWQWTKLRYLPASVADALAPRIDQGEPLQGFIWT